MAANTLGVSGGGIHTHSTRPLGAMSALTSQSDRKAYSAMGGNELAIWAMAGAGAPSGAGWPRPVAFCSSASPRSAFVAIFLLRLLRAHATLPSPIPPGGEGNHMPRARGLG